MNGAAQHKGGTKLNMLKTLELLENVMIGKGPFIFSGFNYVYCVYCVYCAIYYVIP